MDTSFQKTKGTDEWYTPLEMVRALGEFDLDPCAPSCIRWGTAKELITKEQDGLSVDWAGKRVWLNPPYSKPAPFIKKLVEHGNGILLIFNRLDTAVAQDLILPNADAILFLRGRIKFYRQDGTRGDAAGCGSILVAFGQENVVALERSGLDGVLVGR